MTPPRTALVVGAGIGGLAAGVALRRAGWRVRIYERAESSRELGFGLLLAPNALAALRELGIADAVIEAGIATTSFEIRGTDGQLIRRLEGQLGGQAIVALRPVLHGALMDAVGPDALELASEAVSFASSADGVTLMMRDGRAERGDVLIGADGISSSVRRQLHPDEPPPRPSGFSALRGVAYGVADQLGDLAAIGYLGDGIEAATARAGTDAVYWYMSLLSDDVPADVRDAAAVLAPRLSHFEPTLRAVVSATKPDEMRFDVLRRRDPLATWGYGRVTLLGDAAHPVMPHTGQGAAQALEDAVALGLVLSQTQEIERALRRYEAVRSRRTRAFVRMGPRIARVTTTRSALIQAVRSIAIRLVPGFALRYAARRPQSDPHRALRATPTPMEDRELSGYD